MLGDRWPPPARVLDCGPPRPPPTPLMIMLALAAALLASAAAAAPRTPNTAALPLPALSIDPSGISISGLSSGADFVVQFQVAFSGTVKGVGVFAGQPYHCAVTMFKGDPLVSPCFGTHHYNASQPLARGCTGDHPSPDVPYCDNCPPGGRTLLYDHCKRYPKLVDVEQLLAYAREQARAGTIDPLGGLKGVPVYLYRGTKDACYLKGSVALSQTFFDKLGASVLFNRTTPSAHSWPTRGYGTPCGGGVIEDCDYDGPGAALQHIYGGDLKPPAPTRNSSLLEFDQQPFMTCVPMRAFLCAWRLGLLAA